MIYCCKSIWSYFIDWTWIRVTQNLHHFTTQNKLPITAVLFVCNNNNNNNRRIYRKKWMNLCETIEKGGPFFFHFAFKKNSMLNWRSWYNSKVKDGSVPYNYQLLTVQLCHLIIIVLILIISISAHFHEWVIT